MVALNSSLRSAAWTRRDGNALVEFALVLPLLLLIFAGIVDFGFLFQRYEVLTNAAREGARIGVLPGYDAADIRARVLDYVEEGLGMTPTEVADAVGTPGVDEVTLDPGTGSPFAAVRVTANFRYNYVILGPLVNLATGGTWGTDITITARATMRKEIVGS